MALLSIKSLSVSYGNIQALHGIDLEVEKGRIVTLIGANGAGKSTTLRTISGLLRPSGGEILLDEKPIHTLASHEIVQRGVAQVPEGRGIFANLSVKENLELGAYSRKDPSGIAQDLERVLHLFSRLKERLHQNAGTLSGGEQQMLAIGRALMTKPRILLLDEPSLGIAPILVKSIFQMIREINAQGTTILLVEQNAHMALKVAHFAYVLEVGRIAMADEAAVLEKSAAVRKAYLGMG